MDAGFGILGFGLFLLSIAHFYARSGQALGWVIFLLSLVGMGYAFSESHNRRLVAAGLGAAMALIGIVSLAIGAPLWSWLLAFVFAIAFAVLWGELRFPTFFEREEHQEQIPVHHGPSRTERLRHRLDDRLHRHHPKDERERPT